MRLRQLLFSAFVLVQTNTALCQAAHSGSQLSVLVSPAILRARGLQVGVQAGLQQEWKIWAVNAEGAFPIDKRYNDFSKIKSFRFGLEAKRYIAISEDAKPYLSLQLNHTIRNLTDTNGNTYASISDTGWIKYDRAFIQAPISTAALKWGIQFKVNKHLLFDSFAGLGVRYIVTTYKNVEGKMAGYEPGWTDWGDFTSKYRYEGHFTKIHITVGMRVGYILNQ